MHLKNFWTQRVLTTAFHLVIFCKRFKKAGQWFPHTRSEGKDLTANGKEKLQMKATTLRAEGGLSDWNACPEDPRFDSPHHGKPRMVLQA